MPTSPDAERAALPTPTKPRRIDSLDLLRGLVMIVMALDHTRDYFSNADFDPTDLSKTNAALFLTRLVTHFCAPTFVLLAGISAFLYGNKRTNRKDLSWFLFSRGVWLILLEVTLVHWGWSFDVSGHSITGQVIWAIGVSMVVLAGLVWLPTSAILAFGLTMIAGHNLLDGIQPHSREAQSVLWKIVHTGGPIEFAPHHTFFVLYPVVPWIGIMAAGYALGAVYLWPAERRRQFLLRLGAGLLLAFLLVRGLNVYGDPHRWTVQPSPLFTLFSFVNCQKYPPSLDYILMTLGPACLALAVLEQVKGKFASIAVTYGRVPMFYYLLHVPLIHALAIVFAVIQYGKTAALFTPANPPPGYPLFVVYLVWITIVASLYLPCRWFAGVKARHRDKPWLSYL
ncbi:MAG: hypothetical protein JWL77_2348 [Chthonomonadaceae bacterium]|nr:hypothetical protein [Chthonomonadaceae bacterium]